MILETLAVDHHDGRVDSDLPGRTIPVYGDRDLPYSERVASEDFTTPTRMFVCHFTFKVIKIRSCMEISQLLAGYFSGIFEDIWILECHSVFIKDS